MILCRFDDSGGCEVEKMKDEYVGALHFNSKRPDDARRKIPQVHRDNHICVTANSSR
jgi:hypothetical protein